MTWRRTGPAVAAADDIAAVITERYGDVIQRLSFCTAAPTESEILSSNWSDLKRAA